VTGDAVGAICRLTRDAKAETKGAEELPATLTINVEYNQVSYSANVPVRCLTVMQFDELVGRLIGQGCQGTDCCRYVTTTPRRGEKLSDVHLIIGSENISVYPGNINVLIFDAPQYLTVLEAKKGIIAEFVNPKYKVRACHLHTDWLLRAN
jgi:hypothetical protein